MLKVYYGHHKCASTWIINVLLRVTGYLGIKSYYLQNYFDLEYYENVYADIINTKASLIISQSSSMKKNLYLKNTSGFHVIRDPRDVCVSGYYSHLYSHPVEYWPELKLLRSKLQQVPKEEGLFLEMDFLKGFFEDMYEWDYNQTNILEAKFENLTKDPFEEFSKIFTFLELLEEDTPSRLKRKLMDMQWYINILNRRYNYPIPFSSQKKKIDKEQLKKIIDHFDFSRLSNGRVRGDDDKKSHYRKGLAGDWVYHFNKEHKKYFKDNYADILIKLGYETSKDW